MKSSNVEINIITKACPSAWNMGAIFDCMLSMKDHVNAMCKECFCRIRNIAMVRRSLTKLWYMCSIHTN